MPCLDIATSAAIAQSLPLSINFAQRSLCGRLVSRRRRRILRTVSERLRSLREVSDKCVGF